MKLDKKDWKLLAALSKDCRMPLTRVAKAVGVSREVADYRIKKLVENGIIKAFCAEVDVDALGYTKHVVYLELKKVNKEKEQEIFSILKSNPFVSWLTTSTGKWSVFFDLHSKGNAHLSQILRDLKRNLGIHLGEFMIVTLESHHYFHSKPFGTSSLNPIRKRKALQLDKVDYAILKALRRDARIDYVALSKEIRLTPEAISRRIKLMKEGGIIRQFYVFPDFAKLGMEHYNVQISLENSDEIQESKIVSSLKSHPKVSFIYKPISHWDIEFGVLAKNPGELRDFISELRGVYPESIRIRDVSLFYEEIVPNVLPEGVFE